MGVRRAADDVGTNTDRCCPEGWDHCVVRAADVAASTLPIAPHDTCTQNCTPIHVHSYPQVAIVEAGGRAFSTVPLSSTQWAVCVGFGGLTLLLRQALRAIPTEPPPPPSSPPPPHNTTSGQDGGGSGRGWQAAASAAAQSAASALQAAVAAPVRGAKRILQGAGATAVQSHGGRDMGAAKQQGRHLRQQPARR